MIFGQFDLKYCLCIVKLPMSLGLLKKYLNKELFIKKVWSFAKIIRKSRFIFRLMIFLFFVLLSKSLLTFIETVQSTGVASGHTEFFRIFRFFSFSVTLHLTFPDIRIAEKTVILSLWSRTVWKTLDRFAQAAGKIRVQFLNLSGSATLNKNY